MRLKIGIALLFFVSSFALAAQTTTCLDIADEPHHQLLFQNQNVQIYRLDLGRLESTEMYCVAHPFLRIIAADGRTTDLVAGEAGYQHDWHAGEARLVYVGKKKQIRNELSTSYREYVVETLRTVEYVQGDNNYDTDAFGYDVADVKPTWSVTFARAGLAATRTKLAPEDVTGLGTPNYLLIALTEVDLKLSGDPKPNNIALPAGDSQMLKGGHERELKNQGAVPARFITVEF